MSDITDDQLMALARPACGNFRWPSTALEIMRAAIAADRAQRGEPVAVHQFRKAYCADWHDGFAGHEDGGGPYQERTLYTAPPAAPVVPPVLLKFHGYVPPEHGAAGEYYCDGWNDCRLVMLATTPEPKP